MKPQNENSHPNINKLITSKFPPCKNKTTHTAQKKIETSLSSPRTDSPRKKERKKMKIKAKKK